MPNRKFLFTFLLLTGSVLVCAQTAFNEVEILLNTKTVTLGQAARLILDASDTLSRVSQQQVAFNYAKEQNWLPENAAIDDPARMDAVAFLFVKSFDLEGGLLYRLTGNTVLGPHYAYRELVSLKAIQGKTTPNMAVSGEQLLFITGRLLEIRENAQAEN